MRLRKGDRVQVLQGKDRGKTGTVDQVKAKEGKVLVSGVNLFKRHLKPRGQGQGGGIVEQIRPLPASKVALICPKCGKITRIGYQISGNQKARICRACKVEI
jgi:large subunit ribosomal protein L24